MIYRRAKEKFVDNPYDPSNGWYPKDSAEERFLIRVHKAHKDRLAAVANDNFILEIGELSRADLRKKAA